MNEDDQRRQELVQEGVNGNPELQEELDKEREEKKEAELVVASLERKLSVVKDQCALLDAEIEQTRAVVQNMRRGKF